MKTPRGLTDGKKGGVKMPYELAYENKEFSMYYIGKGGGYYSKGGHLFQIEPAAIATQNNALVAEFPRDIVQRAAGGFALNFDITAGVYQDNGEIYAQGEAGQAVEIHYGTDALRIELDRVQCTSGLLINPQTGALWHEARIYALDRAGRVERMHVLGYVPLYAITRFAIGSDELIKHNPRAFDW